MLRARGWQEKLDDLQYCEWRWTGNPLMQGIARVLARVAQFKESARRYYHAVVLSVHECPSCGGALVMTGPSRCGCTDCRTTMDPTVAFQRSSCCNARLVRRTFHYECRKCGAVVPSRFLFDEAVFDPHYFRERMRESRQRKAAQREEIRRMLADSRSEAMEMEQMPSIESVPGLVADLDSFIATSGLAALSAFAGFDEFKLEEYRKAILDGLDCGSRMFSAFPALNGNVRLDKVRRFITLLFMCQAREVALTQYGNDILVSKHEDDDEG
jgi:hypothetical protein